MEKKRYAVQVVREIRMVQSVIVDASDDEEPGDLAIEMVQEKPLGALIEGAWDFLGHTDTTVVILNNWGQCEIKKGN